MADHRDMLHGSASLNRRSFVKLSAATTAALAASGLAACASDGPKTTPAPESTEADAVEETRAPMPMDDRNVTDGTWVSAACWHNCGGRCVNKVLVRDGVVVRQKTDDSHEDSAEFPQQRSCVRGHSQRNQVFSADRLKYPMKRKSWHPGGGENAHGELRGIDEWERISWDEAFELIAGEFTRISEVYGPRAFFGDGGEACKVLSLMGGFIPNWGTTSWGSWRFTAPTVGLPDGFSGGAQGINDRFDIQECDYVVALGINPAWSSAGNPSNLMLQVKQSGAKFIGIDPFYNDSYALVDADWIQCRPSTDTAFLLGVANAMLEMDDEKHLIDWDFLAKCTVGFDADSTPEGEDPQGNFKDYVLGTYDGVPKTPEWASKICGSDPGKIREVAQIVGKDNKVAILSAWANGRTHSSDSLGQVFMTVGAMGGHYGKSGHMCGISGHRYAFNGGPHLVKAGSSGQPSVKNPLAATEGMNHTQMWQGILNGAYTYCGGATSKVPGEGREVDIKLIYHDSSARLQTADGQAMGIEAHRKVDTVVSHGMFLTTNALYSDIVLPVTSMWEVEGGFQTGNKEVLFYHSKVVDPMYETKTDAEIARGLCDKLGLDATQLYAISDHQALFNQLLGATYTDEAGEAKPLLTITAEDIAKWECEGEPQEGVVALDKFISDGVYQIPRKKGDAYSFIAFKDFVEDPDANPLKTATGKLEICSSALRDAINAIGFSTIEAIPTYAVPQEGYEATFSDFEKGTKGEYPYQVYNPHYLRRSHTVFDNVQWLRETWPNPVFLSSVDAAEKGISTGDTVLLTSPHGKCLRKASITHRLMPGVVGLPHGAWVNVDEKTGIDRAGSDNYLTGQVQSGQGTSGWNTCICNLEKYNEALPEDIDVEMRIVSAQA